MPLRPYWIFLAGALIAAAVSIGTGLFVMRLYGAAILHAKNMEQNTAHLVAGQTNLAFETFSAIQKYVINIIIEDSKQQGRTIRSVASSQEIHETLARQVSTFSHIDILAIMDEEASMLNSSRDWPAQDLGIPYESFFNALRNDPNLGVYISEPLQDLQKGEWFIVIAHPLKDAGGRFSGLILGAIQLKHLGRMFQLIAPQPDSAITLFRRDGMILARYPHIDPAIIRKRLNPESPVIKAVQHSQEGATVRAISPFDGKDRIVGIDALKQYPVAVLASSTVEAALASWRSQAILIGFFAILIDAILALACFLGYKQFKANARFAETESHLARHDRLTGLPNRMLFQEELARAFANIGARRRGAALLLLDLDRFKDVNDTLGHAGGDELLQLISRRLQECAGPSNFVARLGGDEFAVIQKEIDGPDDVAALADCLLENICKPYQLSRGQATIGLSIGAAVAPIHGTDSERIQTSADLALYKSKESGRLAFRFYDTQIEAEHSARRQLENDLLHGIEAGEFEVLYQPLLDLRTEAITGFEALLRWRHPQRGHVSPQEFIPVAESTGLIEPLSNWVLREACRTAMTWPESVSVSVNLSPLEFRMRDIYTNIEEALEQTGLPPQRLELEVTESALLEAENAGASLRMLRKLGVSIALDDFGTGYASLAYLQKFPFKKLKIDKSFVDRMQRSSHSESIVQSVLDLAHRLGLTTVAEGVETEEQLLALRAAGCTQAQGYWIARPMAAQDIPAFLAGCTASVGEELQELTVRQA